MLALRYGQSVAEGGLLSKRLAEKISNAGPAIAGPASFVEKES